MSSYIAIWEGYLSKKGHKMARKKKCRYGRKKNGRHGCLKKPRSRRRHRR